MTREEAITKYIVPAIEKTWNDKRCKEILEALEQDPQDPCEDCISRKEVLDYLDKMPSELTLDGRRMVRRRTLEEYISDTLPPVTSQPKMGCEGCIYEKTGNNSTYPCSHCGRCYTDKYKAESEEV